MKRRFIHGLAISTIGPSPEFNGQPAHIVEPQALELLDLNSKSIMANLQHDLTMSLGFNGGTLRLARTRKGLAYSVEVPPGKRGDDIIEAVQSGILTGSSYVATTIHAQESHDRLGRPLLRIQRLYLSHLGPVTQPLNPWCAGLTISDRPLSAVRRIEMKAPPAAIMNANRLLTAALAGSGCEIRGRHLSPGQVHALVSGGPSAVIL